MEYLYILRSYLKDSSLLKFGFSTDIWARLAQYKSTNPGIEIVYIAQLENALELEQAFHKKNLSAWGNEWYNEDMLSVIMDYLNSITHIDYTTESRPKKIITKLCFKETVIECQKGDTDFILAAYKQFPFLEEAIIKIGYEGIIACKYSVCNIKSKIVRLSTGSDKQKIAQSLKNSSHIYEGSFLETGTLKNLFAKIYTDLDVKLIPKANDIQDYYHIKEKVNKVKTNITDIVDGQEITKSVWKSVKGFVIVKSKM
jgi:hypothetical protein